MIIKVVTQSLKNVPLLPRLRNKHLQRYVKMLK